MKIYFSVCDGQRHNYALLDYFCAYSQNFDFTASYGINCYNLPSATLYDAVISDSGRKDTLSINLTISKFILLWTASILMIAAFVLCLSTTTSTTIEVGMKDISTGLVEVFGMIRINLLEERNIFERKSGSAIITSERNNDCECKDAYPSIMSIHDCERLCLDECEHIHSYVRFCLNECEQACSFRFLVRDSLSGLRLSNVPTAHSNMGWMRTHTVLTAVDTAASPFYVYVLQCLVRYIVDHRAESHRVCSAASVMTMYGQQSRVHSRASSHSSHVSLCHRSFQDQSAWSSRASLSLS